jgi:hypothetical protein
MPKKTNPNKIAAQTWRRDIRKRGQQALNRAGVWKLNGMGTLARARYFCCVRLAGEFEVLWTRTSPPDVMLLRRAGGTSHL